MLSLGESDKSYWHGYLDFYESYFVGREIRTIAEIGVYKGDSIRWLLNRFPDARIYGGDIIDRRPEWPNDDRFIFVRMDQGSRSDLSDFFSHEKFDLIIEDGSHEPSHQVSALLVGIQSLSSGGLYLLEDIHTSMPGFNSKSDSRTGNALSVLLAIEHQIRVVGGVDRSAAEYISSGSMMTSEDVFVLASSIADMKLYRRSRLPDYCYRCRSTKYNYHSLKCECGVDLFSCTDSMSYALVRS